MVWGCQGTSRRGVSDGRVRWLHAGPWRAPSLQPSCRVYRTRAGEGTCLLTCACLPTRTTSSHPETPAQTPHRCHASATHNHSRASNHPPLPAPVQEVARRLFEKRTVLTIAHRLDAVIESDTVVVMEAGRVAETGPASTLLNDPNSWFSKLVDMSGAAEAAQLRATAALHFAAQGQLPTNGIDQVNGRDPPLI
jgi:hypothetical protein